MWWMWDVKGRITPPRALTTSQAEARNLTESRDPCLLRFLSSAAHTPNANHFSVAFYFSKTCNIPLACHVHLEGET